MGRIKSAIVKRIAKRLVIEKPGIFTKGFENNKKILGKAVTQKRARNAIAGYITKLAKR